MRRFLSRSFRSAPGRAEMLEPRQMLSATTFESEPNNSGATADAAQFDPADGAVSLLGVIANRRDQDYFRITAAAAGQVQLDALGDLGLAAKVEVQNAQGLDIFETEPNNGVNAGSFAVSAGETYTIRVRGQNKTTGVYVVDLKLDADPIAPPPGSGGGTVDPPPGTLLTETEPNDRESQANLAALGSDGKLTIQGNSTSDRDKDYFRLTPQSSGRLQIDVRADGGQIAKVEVTTASGVKLLETEPNHGVNSLSIDVAAGQTYFVRLRSPNSAPAPYLVDLALA
ncbi:MAG: hypothetical protein K1X74_08750 [Pirellulales bacterium]|nr:hypothetical protein [Pirellulales bacterium]